MQQPPTNQPSDQTVLTELVADLARRNEELAAAAALWQERARFLGERLQALEAGPIAADVPQERNPASPWGDVVAEASEVIQTPAEPHVSPLRRWLRRVIGVE